MIARAIENLFYTSAVAGTHRALTDMGFIDPTTAAGTQADQVRAIVGAAGAAGPAIADRPADAEGEPAEAPKRSRKAAG